MTGELTVVPETPLDALRRRKGLVTPARQRVEQMFRAGTPGVQIATFYCEAIDGILLTLIDEALTTLGPETAEAVARGGAVVAVGGTGRGELCPYSDIDLLFLDGGTAEEAFRQLTSHVVQLAWDAKIELGHSLRTMRECLALARVDPHVATCLIEARLLWGNQSLFDRFERQFQRRVVVGRRRAFLQDCLTARLDEGPQAQELEPDVKNSIGGLRDLHLIRWLGFGVTGVKDLDGLRLKEFLTKEETGVLKSGWEFLTRIRIDLHLAARRHQDRLTRDEQKRIAASRGITDTQEQRAVERLMQEYFQHANRIGSIARRLADRHRPRSLVRTTRNLILGHRADGILRVTPEEIDSRASLLPRVTADLESILKVYKAAALYGVRLSPRLTDAISAATARLPREVSPEAGRLAQDILKCVAPLGPILRSMAATGVLDVLVPDFSRIRSLMQFNQYHHYTVDEHTLRAMETVTGFESEDSPVGAAYREIRQKEVLHLALLLHDVGKGCVTDHCIVGEEVARRIAPRLDFSPEQSEQIAFLIRWHLEMADIAFRRDTSDERLLIDFSRKVGSPDLLRMLYVLTAADVTSVGPGVWTEWKADLLSELFDRCLLILSGKRYSFHERERMRDIKFKVAGILQPTDPAHDEDSWPVWIDEQLQGFSAYYLTCSPPEQIAADLDIIQRMEDGGVSVTGTFEPGTGTVEYRVITRNGGTAHGCFHRICGVFSAKRLEILSADVNTTQGQVVVDTFRVVDTDFSGEVPPERIHEISRLITRVLRGEETIDALFARSRRFGSDEFSPAASELPQRVVIDNDSSESRTVVDVFAHDRPGLLYRIARTLHRLDLEVDLAKISTHFDQVIDVFYLTERDGRKVTGDERLNEVRTALLETLENPMQQ